MAVVDRAFGAGPGWTRSSPGRRHALFLSAALAVLVVTAAGLTFFGDFLVGPPVMNGSARGTALMMVLVGAPALVVSGQRTLRGSSRSVFVWAGMSMYLTYNSFMLLTATPINRLFLLYVAAFGLAVATMIAIARSVDVADLAHHCDSRLPVRGIAVYLGVTVTLNAAAWLGRIIPATVSDTMPHLVEGMGIATVPTYVQDLAFWLPLLALGAWLLWRRHPWGYLICGAGLAFWAVEAATVAVDQWFGHDADPLSDVASASVVVPFAVLAAITTAALWSFLRHVTGATDPATPSRLDRQL